MLELNVANDKVLIIFLLHCEGSLVVCLLSELLPSLSQPCIVPGLVINCYVNLHRCWCIFDVLLSIVGQS